MSRIKNLVYAVETNPNLIFVFVSQSQYNINCVFKDFNNLAPSIHHIGKYGYDSLSGTSGIRALILSELRSIYNYHGPIDIDQLYIDNTISVPYIRNLLDYEEPIILYDVETHPSGLTHQVIMKGVA